MQIIIDIPDADYKSITEDYISYADTESGRVFKAIKEGTVLPEHHGRLIDADALFNEYCEIACEPYINEPTILEADKEQKE